MNAVNRELQELKRMIVHYNTIIETDKKIKKGDINNTDNRPLLSDKDLFDIHNKLVVLYEKRNNLLLNENDYDITFYNKNK